MDSREIVFAVALLLAVSEFSIAQDIAFETDDDVPEIPVSECRCVQVRRCRPLMARPDWKEVISSMKVCGYRRVCCPSRLNVPETKPIPILPKERPRPPTPPSRRPSIPAVVNTPETTSPPRFSIVTAPSTKACGQSKFMSDETSRDGDVLESLIVGGENATQGEFPWMVAINEFDRYKAKDFVPTCTGFLIDNIHVITAAHCFKDSRDPAMFVAKIGHIYQSKATTYNIRKIVPHEGYITNMYYNDVAVMTLTEPVKDPHVSPICLPTEDIMRTNLTGKGVTVAGWGSEKFQGDLTYHLKKLEHVPIITNRACNRVIRRLMLDKFTKSFPNGITEGFICAGFEEGKQDACGGDSGGPVMLQRDYVYYVVGVVSFGIGCGRPGVPAGYTRVSSHIKWIVDNTRD